MIIWIVESSRKDDFHISVAEGLSFDARQHHVALVIRNMYPNFHWDTIRAGSFYRERPRQSVPSLDYNSFPKWLTMDLIDLLEIVETCRDCSRNGWCGNHNQLVCSIHSVIQSALLSRKNRGPTERTWRSRIRKIHVLGSARSFLRISNRNFKRFILGASLPIQNSFRCITRRLWAHLALKW